MDPSLVKSLCLRTAEYSRADIRQHMYMQCCATLGVGMNKCVAHMCSWRACRRVQSTFIDFKWSADIHARVQVNLASLEYLDLTDHQGYMARTI